MKLFQKILAATGVVVLATGSLIGTPAKAGGFTPDSCSAVGQGYSLSQVQAKLGTKGVLTSTTAFMGTVSKGYNFYTGRIVGRETCVVVFQGGVTMMSTYMKF